MKSMRIFSVVLFALAIPVLASALDFFGQSRTYLQSREGADTSRFLPLYEYLDLRAENSAGGNISFRFGGWARIDLADASSPLSDRKTNNDLQYAYLSLRRDKGNSLLSLGRFFVYEGAVSGLVDGAYARTDFIGGLGIAAFGGVPVETDFDGRSGDTVYGGRISQGYPGVYRIGYSYIKEKNNRTDFREEAGGDLWFRPVRNVELTGSSLHNALTKEWARHDYTLSLGPFSGLSIRPAFTFVSYKDYFTGVTMSAFMFGPTGLPNLDEKLSTAGGDVLYSFGKTTLSADYKKYNYDIAGNADYYGAKVVYSLPSNWGSGLSAHRMNGETDALRYYDYRVYGYKKFGKADITADLFLVSYDVAINGVKHAYAAVLAGGYSVLDRARIAADVEYAHNPYFDSEVRGMVKFAWNFGSPYGTNGEKKKGEKRK